MKVVLNCDAVFDILTRGPFPAGCGEDEQVELHLRACHTCREVAEALRPAVNLFHESLTAEEESHLPAYRGCVEKRVAAGRYADPMSARLPGMADAGASSAASSALTHLVIGCLAGLAAALVFWLGQLPHEPAAKNESRTTVQAPGAIHGAINGAIHGTIHGTTHQPDAEAGKSEGRPLLASLGLPLSCFPHPTSSEGRLPATVTLLSDAQAAGGSPARVCCTRCHFSGGERLTTPQSLPRLTLACAACHAKGSSPGDQLIGRPWPIPSRRLFEHQPPGSHWL